MEKNKLQHIIHPIPPFYDETSKILVLGSFPSPKSRESAFFYGHPRNRFWKMMTILLIGSGKADDLNNEEIMGQVPSSKEEKAAFLKRFHIAAWDSIHECDIVGASDSSIRNVTPNDLSIILKAAPIKQVCCNGKKSHEIYMKYCYPATGRKALALPSTSPANAAFTMDKLLASWQCILDVL